MPIVAKKAKTRAQFATAICAVHTRAVRRSLEDAIQIGRMLIEAKNSLAHGEYLEMVESDLPFGKRAAQMLTAIAEDPRFQKANQGSLFLTLSWRTVYELTRLPDAVLEQAKKMGMIRPGMTRSDVERVAQAFASEARTVKRTHTVPPLHPQRRRDQGFRP